MSRKLILLTLMLALALSGCTSSQSTKEAGALTKVSLPMGYVPNIQFAPLYVAAEKGYFRDAGIDVEFDYKTETDGVALVGSGELPFSLVSSGEIRKRNLAQFKHKIAILDKAGVKRSRIAELCNVNRSAITHLFEG